MSNVDTLLEWDHYPPDTWASEVGDQLLLIKLVEEAYVFVFGTTKEPLFSGSADTLSDAQAIANRYRWLVNNVTPERLDSLVNKL